MSKGELSEMNNMEASNIMGITGAHSRYNVVKIGFGGYYRYKNTDKKNLRMQVCIGTGIAMSLGWKNPDEINISYCENYFLLNKTNKDQYKDSGYKVFKGYKLREIPSTYSYGFSITCNFTNVPSEKGLRTVNHEIIEQDGEKCLKVFFEKEER